MQKIHDFHSIIDRLTTSQRISNRVPRNYGIDMELYTNEIHLLDIVEKYPEYNLSEIATRIQMSKMAISALAKKLQAKGLLEIKQGKNKKELICTLTPRGEVAVATHAAYHKMEDIFLTEKLSKYTEEELKLVEGFLEDYAQYLEMYAKDPTML
ncbi:MAG: MarR family transcriptional regulator [Oscillospiraceae bacterium]|nr:MarR family transcriptional regulator [Oscillospiraceae bacterium]